MPITSLALLALPLALQAAPVEATPPALADIADLPIEEATAPRCGLACGFVEGWQESGDPRGENWPDIASSGAREFFVRAMVRLIDAYGLEREDVMRLVQNESKRHEADNGAAIEAMLPACLALLETSSPQQ